MSSEAYCFLPSKEKTPFSWEYGVERSNESETIFIFGSESQSNVYASPIGSFQLSNYLYYEVVDTSGNVYLIRRTNASSCHMEYSIYDGSTLPKKVTTYRKVIDFDVANNRIYLHAGSSVRTDSSGQTTYVDDDDTNLRVYLIIGHKEYL